MKRVWLWAFFILFCFAGCQQAASPTPSKIPLPTLYSPTPSPKPTPTPTPPPNMRAVIRLTQSLTLSPGLLSQSSPYLGTGLMKIGSGNNTKIVNTAGKTILSERGGQISVWNDRIYWEDIQNGVLTVYDMGGKKLFEIRDYRSIYYQKLPAILYCKSDSDTYTFVDLSGKSLDSITTDGIWAFGQDRVLYEKGSGYGVCDYAGNDLQANLDQLSGRIEAISKTLVCVSQKQKDVTRNTMQYSFYTYQGNLALETSGQDFVLTDDFVCIGRMPDDTLQGDSVSYTLYDSNCNPLPLGETTAITKVVPLSQNQLFCQGVGVIDPVGQLVNILPDGYMLEDCQPLTRGVYAVVMTDAVGEYYGALVDQNRTVLIKSKDWWTYDSSINPPAYRASVHPYLDGFTTAMSIFDNIKQYSLIDAQGQTLITLPNTLYYLGQNDLGVAVTDKNAAIFHMKQEWAPLYKTTTIRMESVNLRISPDATSLKLGELKKGISVDVLKVGLPGGWAEIVGPGGFVAYLKESNLS